MYVKIHSRDENEDTKLRQQYKGIYTISKFISSTNVILVDEKGKALPRSVYINNLKKYKTRINFSKQDSSSDSDSDDTIIYDKEDDTNNNTNPNNNNSNCIIQDIQNNNPNDQEVIHVNPKNNNIPTKPTSTSNSNPTVDEDLILISTICDELPFGELDDCEFADM